MAEPQGQAIDVGQLPIEQLNSLQDQLQNEVQHLGSSLEQLAIAYNRFNDSNKFLDIVTPANEGKETLVPLTSSLYVPGKMGDSKSVLIDIGTGYYVERTPKQAQEYTKRKMDLLKTNIDEVQKALGMKRRNLEVVSMVFQQKQAALSQQQA